MLLTANKIQKVNLMNRILLLSLLSAVFFPALNYGQKSVLGYPRAYVRPLNPYENSSIATFTSPNTQKDKDSNNGWWVVVDRDGVNAYDKPSTSSKVQATLEFGRSLYVHEVKDGFAYLIDAIVDRTQVKELKGKIGWVKIDNLLLWKEGLVNPRTKIHLKALLLNKFSDFGAVPCDKKELVKVFTDPVSNTPQETVNIYRFYFVYKIEKTRYLLAETPTLGFYDAKDRILGWVDKDRIAEWNTRIALEPNFTESGYAERKTNDNLRIAGFKDQFVAEEYSRSGKKVDVTWQRDPVTAKKLELSKTDSKRFRGEFMRFPLLSVGEQKGAQKTLPYYKSAVCDEVLVKVKCVDGKIMQVEKVPMGDAADANNFLEKYQAAADNFNVFFVIESSADLESYKDQMAGLPEEIEGIVRGLNPKVRIKFGALTYKDITESSNIESLVKFTELSADKSGFERFIRNADFSNPNSNGNYPVQNYGIAKALEVAKFNPFHTNLMIIIGKRGDYSHDRLMRMDFSKSKANKDVGALSNAINSGNINLVGIQCVGGDLEADKSFARNIRGLILEAARKNYNQKFVTEKIDPRASSAFSKVGYVIKSPEMDDPDETNDPLLALQNGKLRGNIFRISTDAGAISPTDLSQFATEMAQIITESNMELFRELERWKTGEIEPENGFTPIMAQILVDLYKETNVQADWSEEKFELYNETYFAKQSSSAKEPSFSFVLFWPQSDLLNYFQSLNRLVTNMGNGSAADRRRNLKDAYCKLLEEFTGGEHDKECTEYSVDEIFQIIQGVQAEGVSFNLSGKTIDCILDPKCTSDAEVEAMIKRFVRIRSELNELINRSENEFVFKRGGEFFFWIKVEDVF